MADSSSALPPGTGDAPHDPSRMSFFDHLGELRRRLLYCLACLLVTTAACWTYHYELFTFASYPLHGLNVKMMTFGPLDMFITYIKLSVLCGLLLASPFVLTQLWLFIAPGLYPHEKRFVVPFVVLGTGCLVGGAAFCFYGVLPSTFKFLLEMNPEEVISSWSVDRYFALITELMLAFGMVFELPIIMALLAAAGLVGAAAFARFRKYWVILAFIIGGILTPTPDPMTQSMMALPLVAFFELGILAARLMEHRRPRPA